MKTRVDNRLFWFLKNDTKLDLSNKADLDMYVQQTLSRGRTADIRRLFRMVDRRDLIESLGRLNSFLPKEVRKFWEEWLEDINQSAKADTRPLQ